MIWRSTWLWNEDVEVRQNYLWMRCILMFILVVYAAAEAQANDIHYYTLYLVIRRLNSSAALNEARVTSWFRLVTRSEKYSRRALYFYYTFPIFSSWPPPPFLSHCSCRLTVSWLAARRASHLQIVEDRSQNVIALENNYILSCVQHNFIVSQSSFKAAIFVFLTVIY